MKKETRLYDSETALTLYNDALNGSHWWGRAYLASSWQGINERAITSFLLQHIPHDFHGKILDVPSGTLFFTHKKYARLPHAHIDAVDTSAATLKYAQTKITHNLPNVLLHQASITQLPFVNETYDITISMNGFHVIDDKEKAYNEIKRTLKPGGTFLGTFYIKGNSKKTDFIAQHILTRMNIFHPPFETADSLIRRLKKDYHVRDVHIEGSFIYFVCQKPEKLQPSTHSGIMFPTFN